MNQTLEILREMTKHLGEKDYELKQLNSVIVDLIGGVSIIDQNGEYVQVNDKYAEICGYSPEELIGKQWVVTVFEDDLTVAGKCYLEMVQNGKSTLVFRGKKKNNTIFNKSIILVSMKDSKDDFVGHYCFMNNNG